MEAAGCRPTPGASCPWSSKTSRGSSRLGADRVRGQPITKHAEITCGEQGSFRMQKITTFLTFKDQAEEAVNLYTSIFKNSRILSTSRYGEAGPGPKGGLMTANFELDGQEFVAVNGGPSFEFAQGISLLVDGATQDEVDGYWEKLSDGGSKGPCGWLTDKFGVS